MRLWFFVCNYCLHTPQLWFFNNCLYYPSVFESLPKVVRPFTSHHTVVLYVHVVLQVLQHSDAYTARDRLTIHGAAASYALFRRIGTSRAQLTLVLVYHNIIQWANVETVSKTLFFFFLLLYYFACRHTVALFVRARTRWKEPKPNVTREEKNFFLLKKNPYFSYCLLY